MIELTINALFDRQTWAALERQYKRVVRAKIRRVSPCGCQYGECPRPKDFVTQVIVVASKVTVCFGMFKNATSGLCHAGSLGLTCGP